MQRSLPFGIVLTTLLLVACGDGSGGVDAGRDAALNVPAESCAQPGDVGNDLGIGHFCTPRGRECADFPMAGLCLAQVAPDDNQWFCTRTCTSDDQCGTNAVCDGDSRGRACIPAECAPPRVDAGMDDAGVIDDGGVSDDAGDLDAAADDAGAAPDATAGA